MRSQFQRLYLSRIQSLGTIHSLGCQIIPWVQNKAIGLQTKPQAFTCSPASSGFQGHPGLSNQNLGDQIEIRAVKCRPGLSNRGLKSFLGLLNHPPGFEICRRAQLAPLALEACSALSNHSLGSQITPRLSNFFKPLPWLPNQSPGFQITP